MAKKLNAGQTVYVSPHQVLCFILPDFAFLLSLFDLFDEHLHTNSGYWNCSSACVLFKIFLFSKSIDYIV